MEMQGDNGPIKSMIVGRNKSKHPVKRFLSATIILVPFLAFLLASARAHAGAISYAYDSAGRLIGIDYGTNRTTSYSYDKAGNLLQSASPTPSLASSQAGNRLVFSWPLFPAGFTLQSSPSLTPPSWSPASGTQSVLINQVTLTLPVPPTNTFYRLAKP